MGEAPLRFVTDFLGPEHDNDHVHSRNEITTYVICSTPRSGSGLLSRGLAAIGSLGTPLEYFNPAHRQHFSERWGCGTDLKAYVDGLLSRRSTPSGLFGVKIHWAQMAQVRAEAASTVEDSDAHAMPDGLLDFLFPSPCFIRIVRMDRESQAVSLWRANWSNIWSVGLDDELTTDHAPPYSFEGIEDCRRVIENGDSCWQSVVRARGASAIVVTYEGLAASFTTTIQRVAHAIAPDISVPDVTPITRKLSDEISVEMVERYRAERRAREP